MESYKRSGIAYKAIPNPPTFYMAAVAIPCLTQNGPRKPLDLRKLGEVACLEYYVAARIKEKTDDEPKLNLK